MKKWTTNEYVKENKIVERRHKEKEIRKCQS